MPSEDALAAIRRTAEHQIAAIDASIAALPYVYTLLQATRARWVALLEQPSEQAAQAVELAPGDVHAIPDLEWIRAQPTHQRKILALLLKTPGRRWSVIRISHALGINAGREMVTLVRTGHVQRHEDHLYTLRDVGAARAAVADTGR